MRRASLQSYMALAAFGLCIAGYAAAAPPVRIDLPPDSTRLAPGPGVEAAAVCVACHSADYIATQPRDIADMRGFWTREVTKMRRVFGAPINDSEATEIIGYLVTTYGPASGR